MKIIGISPAFNDEGLKVFIEYAGLVCAFTAHTVSQAMTKAREHYGL